MDSKKFVMSYSGGKDCMLAMYRKIKEGWTPVALITTVKKDSVDSWTHSISKKLLEKASESLNIPIIYVECEMKDYEAKFEEKLLEAKKMGATTVIYGDIDIELHRQWDIDRATNAGLDYELPLWQGDREKVVHEFIDAGFKAVIKKVNLENMSEDFLGKTLTKELIEKMFILAEDLKKRFYGNRIVMFAPLYLSNYCVNGCVYCPYHAKIKL